MDSERLEYLLIQAAAGELSPAEQEELAAHLAGHPEDRKRLEYLQAADGFMKEAIRSPSSASELRGRMRRALGEWKRRGKARWTPRARRRPMTWAVAGLAAMIALAVLPWWWSRRVSEQGAGQIPAGPDNQVEEEQTAQRPTAQRSPAATLIEGALTVFETARRQDAGAFPIFTPAESRGKPAGKGARIDAGSGLRVAADKPARLRMEGKPGAVDVWLRAGSVAAFAPGELRRLDLVEGEALVLGTGELVFRSRWLECAAAHASFLFAAKPGASEVIVSRGTLACASAAGGPSFSLAAGRMARAHEDGSLQQRLLARPDQFAWASAAGVQTGLEARLVDGFEHHTGWRALGEARVIRAAGSARSGKHALRLHALPRRRIGHGMIQRAWRPDPGCVGLAFWVHARRLPERARLAVMLYTPGGTWRSDVPDLAGTDRDGKWFRIPVRFPEDLNWWSRKPGQAPAFDPSRITTIAFHVEGGPFDLFVDDLTAVYIPAEEMVMRFKGKTSWPPPFAVARGPEAAGGRFP